MKTKTKVLFLIALSAMMICKVMAQVPAMEWVVQMGGAGLDNGRSISIDNGGNIITTGRIEGTVICTLPGEEGSFSLTTVGQRDVFIQKLGPDGSHIWTRHCGGSGAASGQEVTTDPAGNIIVLGNFSGTVDFDPGPGIFNLTNMGNEYVGTATFILKLDAYGNFIWAKQTGPIYGGTSAMESTQDAAGNLIITGYFQGQVDFDPGPGTAIYSCGDYQVFILKLDAMGNFLWVKEFGSNDYLNHAQGYSVIADASLNVYTTGSFLGAVDFDPSKKGRFILTSKGALDIFIQKSDPNGNFLWAKQMGGTGDDVGMSITRNVNGNIYLSGRFSSTADFDPGPGIFNLVCTATSSSAFIQKLDAAGNFVWVRQVEGAGTDTNWSGTWSVNTDDGANVYVAGYFGGSADFDPGSGTFIKTCTDTVDCFILKLDPQGAFQWAQQMGGQGSNCGLAIHADHNGNVYSAGFFSGDATGFDPANPNFQLHSQGYRDYFLQKLNQGAICDQPSGLIATNIYYYSATLNWNAVAGAASYNVRYRINGSGNWVEESGILNTSLTLTGLSPMTNYEFQVQTNCGEGYSAFSPSSTFTTPGLVCTDTYEPNEIQGTSKTISANTNIGALIAISSDIDWFKFNNNNKNRNIKITLANLPANYDVALYNSGGAQIGISQNEGTEDETIIYNTSVLGTYYIKVYGNSGVFEPNLCYSLKASISSTGFKSIESEDEPDPGSVDMSVYPNPANYVVNLGIDFPTDGKISIRMTDLSGRTVRADEFNVIQGVNHYTIDLNDLRDGIYFIMLTSGSQKSFKKLVIAK